MARKMVIKGVGTMMAKRYKKDGTGVEVLTLGTLQDLKIDFNTEIEDIFGGDGLFAIDTLVTEKSIEVTATDAKFDLDTVQLMMGSAVQEDVISSLWVLNEQKQLIAGDLDPATPGTAVAEVTPEFAGTLFGDGNFAVRLKDTNSLLTKIAHSLSTAPAVDEFMVEPATGRLILNDGLIGQDIVFNYQREETVDIAEILVDEVPFPVHIVHHGSFLQKDGSFAGVETELYSCLARGQFSIDAQRASASSSQVQLKIIDPERADGKLGTIKRYSSNKRV